MTYTWSQEKNDVVEVGETMRTGKGDADKYDLIAEEQNTYRIPESKDALCQEDVGYKIRPETVRKFETGATREVDDFKYDYEGFLSPLVIEEFGRYMHKHRIQADGSLRDSDNWQKGMPLRAYIKSGLRHFRQWWSLHRRYPTYDEKGIPITIKDALCGVMFNVMGYLHTLLLEEQNVNSSRY